MPKRSDYTYPLHPDQGYSCRLGSSGELLLPQGLQGQNLTWLLEVTYRAKSWAPSVRISSSTGVAVEQFFESNCYGRRYINLTGVLDDKGSSIWLREHGCSIERDAILMGFTQPALDAGPVLILAPHADDAELAAFGLYRTYAQNCWIVTISAGEQLSSLKKQYVPKLDNSIAAAAVRKGTIRAWNSVTTPTLAGVPPERSIMLGYFNMTLQAMLDAPAQVIQHPAGLDVSPATFRKFNRISLQSDRDVRNSGEMLIADLTELINVIRPQTILVTHPELDPHDDHIAAANALAYSLARLDYYPRQVLLYANHYRQAKGFPYGPEHAGTALPPADMAKSRLGPWRVYSHSLSVETQKEKVVALDTMHDLRYSLRLRHRGKQLWRRWTGRSGYQFYGAHPYFQTAIKAHELFVNVSGEAFVAGILANNPELSSE